MARWAKVPGSGGRKIWIPSKKDLAEIKYYASQGLPHKTVAALFNISPHTLSNAMERDPNVMSAWIEGRAQGEHILVDELWKKATDGKSRDQFQAIKFILERKMGWTEKQQVETAKAKPSKVKFKIAEKPVEEDGE